MLAFAEPLEPATTRLVGEVLRYGTSARNQLLVVDGDSGVAGAAVITQRCRGRWHATAAVTEPHAAAPLAAAIDTSRAWSLTGMSEHVALLVPSLRRTIGVGAAPFHASAIAVEQLAEPDPRIRPATPADLAPLVDLYSRFEQQDIPTRPRLRAFLRDALDALPVLVAEVDGRLVGAVRCDWAARHHDFWWAQTVEPEQRGTGLGNSLLFAAMAHSGERQRKVCGIMGPSNPIRAMEGRGWQPFMHLKEHHLENEWMTVRLGPPSRSMVHRVTRRVLETMEGRTGTR